MSSLFPGSIPKCGTRSAQRQRLCSESMEWIPRAGMASSLADLVSFPGGHVQVRGSCVGGEGEREVRSSVHPSFADIKDLVEDLRLLFDQAGVVPLALRCGEQGQPSSVGSELRFRSLLHFLGSNWLAAYAWVPSPSRRSSPRATRVETNVPIEERETDDSGKSAKAFHRALTLLDAHLVHGKDELLGLGFEMSVSNERGLPVDNGGVWRGTDEIL